MRLKWDKNYLKICMYVVFTLVCTYSLFKVVDSAAYIVTNMGTMLDGVAGIIGSILSVFSVLIMSFVISYLLDPLVEFFQKHYDVLKREKIKPFLEKKLKNVSIFKHLPKKEVEKTPFKKRTAGVAITYIFIFSLIGLFILLATLNVRGKFAGEKDAGFMEALAQSTNATLKDFSDFYIDALLKMDKWNVADYLSDFVSNIISVAKNVVTSFSLNIANFITSAGSMIVDFGMSMVVAFYFLSDKNSIQHRVNDLSETFFSAKVERRIRELLGDIHVVFSGYIRGQLTDAAIMGFLLSVGLSIVGIDFAVLIGVFSGFANIIPYFGAFVGFILSVSVALLSGDTSKAIYAGIVVIILQQIDGMFIVPKVVGEKVEISPALVLLSLSIAGSLFGIVGMIFAVPSCAIIKIFLIRFTERHKRNKLEKQREIKFNKTE